jgi:hypothetical protein
MNILRCSSYVNLIDEWNESEFNHETLTAIFPPFSPAKFLQNISYSNLDNMTHQLHFGTIKSLGASGVKMKLQHSQFLSHQRS